MTRLEKAVRALSEHACMDIPSLRAALLRLDVLERAHCPGPELFIDFAALAKAALRMMQRGQQGIGGTRVRKETRDA